MRYRGTRGKSIIRNTCAAFILQRRNVIFFPKLTRAPKNPADDSLLGKFQRRTQRILVNLRRSRLGVETNNRRGVAAGTRRHTHEPIPYQNPPCRKQTNRHRHVRKRASTHRKRRTLYSDSAPASHLPTPCASLNIVDIDEKTRAPCRQPAIRQTCCSALIPASPQREDKKFCCNTST